MDVKTRRTLVGEKGGRYCVHLLTWDKRRERASGMSERQGW
jgi:hypothetical protein